ncbi:NAD(P)-binding protein [Ophiobolus disseminans]|uniref:NAD(P)-binding protein n=1 Tax=Ophiobolus disseminans TaxID=1469910 RepID=A0A6A7A9F3_9PLEO|nr:NAD(P)-binding protein [Ophiobolus disseminans]
MASTISSTLSRTVHEPLFTGALLYLLTRGPVHIRQRLLGPFQTTLLAKNSAVRLAAFVTVLKILTSVGVVRRVNDALNSLAWNQWRLFGRPGAQFKFGPEKEEMIVITGGSSGFGYEMVKAFAEYARVVVLDVADFPEELASLRDVHFYKCDVTDTPAVEELCKEIRRDHGEATVLVNNAGIGTGKTVLETSNAQCEKLFKVNLTSHFVLIREFLPGMLRQKKGHIVTIASMASFVAAPGLLDYCCSKIGALYLSEGIRAECMTHYTNGRSICTTSVHPSWHQTGIIKGVEAQLTKRGVILGAAKDVSDMVVKQVLSGKSGQLIVPQSDGRKTGVRFLPMWAQDILYGHLWQRKHKGGFVKE